MIKYYLFIFLAFPNLMNAQNKVRINNINLIEKKLKLTKTEIYIICRGTLRKSALIAHTFNYTDTNITHIGVGFIENGKLLIYNVIDIYEKNKSALIVDSLESFLLDKDAYYYSIWKVESNYKEVEKLKLSCFKIAQKKIFFDIAFNNTYDDTLYCSEFCVRALKMANNKKFNFYPAKKKLSNALYEAVLKRKELIYFPVDFFQKDNRFKKIFESNL